MDQKTTTLLFAVLTAAIFFSCSKDSKDEEPEPEIERDYSVCDSAEVAAYTGTMCCIAGPLQALPGETLEFVYRSNIEGGEYEWDVISGSVTIVEGHNTAVAKVKFGSDFTGATIRGKTIAPYLCYELHEITLISK